MIMKESERGNASNLAQHLMNMRDNEHIEVHELLGFIDYELPGVSRGARDLSWHKMHKLSVLPLTKPSRSGKRARRGFRKCH